MSVPPAHAHSYYTGALDGNSLNNIPHDAIVAGIREPAPARLAMRLSLKKPDRRIS